MSVCPICRKAVNRSSSAPFCSARCKQVDLGKWLNEDYRIETNERSDATSDESDVLAAGKENHS
jgi:endogenous inhibitor of DNA gyrase (YacG/DUF329 family)